jgi:peptidoglycan/xylan/chitin deacetylase (PgdA/CDA1 family)
MLRKFKIPAYAVLKATGVFALCRALTGNELRILCYHGISMADEEQWFPGLFMKPEVLRKRFELMIAQGWRILGLDEALKLQAGGKLPRNSVVITFDDGYYNNYTLALPVIREFNLPVTIYVTTYYVTHQNPIFRLAAMYICWKGGKPITDRKEEGPVWDEIHKHETESTEEQRLAYLRTLAASMGVDFQKIFDSRILHLMTPDEVRKTAEAGIDIQLHTHRHRLPRNAADAEREIVENRAVLEPLVGRRIDHFCYPRGLWCAEHFEPLAKQGVASATLVQPGLNSSSTSRFALRRFLDSEQVSELEFEAEMSGFVELARRAIAAVRRLKAPGLPHGVPETLPR